MYPTISDLINDLFGIFIPLPVQTFGFFMALSFLLAAYTLNKELKRLQINKIIPIVKVSEEIGKPASFSELVSQALIGFILGFKIIFIVFNYNDFVQDTQGILLSGRGSFIGGILGAVALAYLRYREKDKKKKEKVEQHEREVKTDEMVSTITMIAAVAGLLGAKLFHNLENFDELINDPIGSLLSFSGLTFFGGLLMGAAAVLYQAHKYGIKPFPMCDAAAPGLMLSYGFGRLGCHLSGDGDWGINNLSPKPDYLNFLPDWIWSYSYPNNVINEGVPIPGCTGTHCMILEYPVWPTPLYEASACIILFFVLWKLRLQFKTPGILFGIYLIFTGTERFLIEKIRINNKFEYFGYTFTQAELIALMIVLTGIVLIYFVNKKKKQSHVSS
ncbi:MAG TPA: prolipoprotein diacylglyceryl transferase [Bacteroidia bacterium]|nr:prolipoprotein diacylglyceryl transferase [Bacteroidia bacterium]HNT79942.1 prolipoprotein diacylglyceryl transferase [Bacteroidia bacterium]